MIKSKPELNFYIMADRLIAGHPGHIQFDEIVRSLWSPNHILMYLKSMRYTAYWHNVRKKSVLDCILCQFHRWRYKRLGVKLGLSIGFNVFGYGLLIPHYGTIVVRSDAVAGNYCVLHTSTCIGGKGHRIGHGFYLATGSLVIGEHIEIDDNITVAANSFVNCSINTTNSLYTGNPASFKKHSLPWFERDGDEFKHRVRMIDQMRSDFK